MRLAEVVRGKVYVDVNVFYMYLRPPAYLPMIREFFGRVVQGDIEAYTSVLTMDELFYRLLLARIKDVYQRDPLQVLREDTRGAIARCGSEIGMALHRKCWETLPPLDCCPEMRCILRSCSAWD